MIAQNYKHIYVQLPLYYDENGAVVAYLWNQEILFFLSIVCINLIQIFICVLNVYLDIILILVL